MDNRTIALMSMYSKLKRSLEKEDKEPEISASAEVLGCTGSWLSKLSNYELVVLQDQIVAQLRCNYEKGIN